MSEAIAITLLAIVAMTLGFAAGWLSRGTKGATAPSVNARRLGWPELPEPRPVETPWAWPQCECQKRKEGGS